MNLRDKILKFDLLRKEVLTSIPNFSEINALPKFNLDKKDNVSTDFINEDIKIKDIDYYYSNSISRASKTMSECRKARKKIKKTGTDN